MPAEPLRVLVVAANASAKWGGEAVLPLHLFRGLRAAGQEAWLCVGRETKAELDELLGPDASRVEYVEDTLTHAVFRWLEARTPRWLAEHPYYYCGVLLTQLKQRRLVPLLVKRHGIHVVHQPTPVSPKVPSFLTGLPVPLVVGPMNGGMTYPPGFESLDGRVGSLGREAARYFSVVMNLLMTGKTKADCLLVANKRTKAALPPRVRGKVLEIVENGVDASLWTSRANDLPSNVDPAERPFELIFIGRLERWKGVEWLVEAVSRASRRVSCRLRVVGDLRDECRRLEARAAQLGIRSRVEFLGWQPQGRCAELLGESDVLVLPSVFECGGAVVLEAMASGKPVIAVAWGGPADYLDPDCGVLIPPTHPASLVSDLEEAIVSLATDRDRCLRMGRAGRRKVLAHYTWPVKTERMMEVYRMVLEGREQGWVAPA